MIPLNNATLADLPKNVARFAYDRAAVQAGIVHLAVGNYHRAHQAFHTDHLLSVTGDLRWGICGVGIQDTQAERAKAASLKKQDQLYTLTRYLPDSSATRQVVGSIVEYLYAPDELETVLSRLASPTISLVTMTITEAGYNEDRQTGAYCLHTPDVKADLANPRAPKTVFGIIVEGLRRRRDAGLAPFTLLSCDNLSENGKIAKNAVVTHARAIDPALADWIDANGAFPSSMVDGITPSVGPAERDRLNAASGVADEVPVFSETFMGWSMEDRFCGPRPAWEKIGARFVPDVLPYEHAKLHMLNASHSVCAYPAFLMGLTYIHEAMAQPLIRELVRQYMEQDVIPHLAPAAGLDLQAYKDLVIDRFSCTAIADQLTRVCGGGADKLPVFIGPMLRKAVETGRNTDRMVFLVACFLQYLGGVKEDGTRYAPPEPGLTPEALVWAASDDAQKLAQLPTLADMGITADTELMADVLETNSKIRQYGITETLAPLVHRDF